MLYNNDASVYFDILITSHYPVFCNVMNLMRDIMTMHYVNVKGLRRTLINYPGKCVKNLTREDIGAAFKQNVMYHF